MLDLLWVIEPEALALWITSEARTFEDRARAAVTLACTCKAGREIYVKYLLQRLITAKELLDEAGLPHGNLINAYECQQFLMREAPKVIRKERIRLARHARGIFLKMSNEEVLLSEQYINDANANLDYILACIEELHADSLFSQLPVHLRRPSQPGLLDPRPSQARHHRQPYHAMRQLLNGVEG